LSTENVCCELEARRSHKKKSLFEAKHGRLKLTWEVEIGRIDVQSQPGQKVSETLSQQIIWVCSIYL
jgi:hypothetical protein